MVAGGDPKTLPEGSLERLVWQVLPDRAEEVISLAEEFGRAPGVSIDAFLASPSRAERYRDLGKLLVALAVGRNEDERNLKRKLKRNEAGYETIGWVDYDWLSVLFRAMDDGFKTFGQNEVAFVTFNYDRSIEHTLTNALVSKYGVSPAEAWSQIKKIPVHHVYGSLGNYNPEEPGEGHRPYRPVTSREEAETAAQSIRLIAEERMEGSDSHRTARHLIGHAERVFVLGFGFDEANCKLLGVAGRSAFQRSQVVRCTSLGMEDGEVSLASFRMKHAFAYRRKPGPDGTDSEREPPVFESTDCKTMLRKYVWALM